jgi:hypothetical protein
MRKYSHLDHLDSLPCGNKNDARKDLSSAFLELRLCVVNALANTVKASSQQQDTDIDSAEEGMLRNKERNVSQNDDFLSPEYLGYCELARKQKDSMTSVLIADTMSSNVLPSCISKESAYNTPGSISTADTCENDLLNFVESESEKFSIESMEATPCSSMSLEDIIKEKYRLEASADLLLLYARS